MIFRIRSIYFLFYRTIFCDIYERILIFRDLACIISSVFRNFILSCLSFYCSILSLNSWTYFYFFLTSSSRLFLKELVEDNVFFDLIDAWELIVFCETYDLREIERISAEHSDYFLRIIVLGRFFIYFYLKFIFVLLFLED